MSGSLGDLVVSIRADIARFQNDMGKMQRSAQDSADRISRSLGGLDGAIKKVGSAFATLGIGLSAAALTSWVKGAIDAADELAKMSQRVGLTVQELAKLNYAGSLADVSMEQLAKGLKQLSKNMVEAAGGSKEQVAAFRALGVEFRNADGSMRKVPEVFSDIAEKVSLLDDGAVKTAISMKVFGKSGADLIPLLNSGAKGLQEMSAEAERLGLVIDERTAKAAENFNDNLTRLQSSGKGLAFAISEVMLPPLVQLTDELNRVAQADNKWLKIIGYMQTIVKLQTNPLSYVWDPLAGAKKKPGSISDIAGGIAGAAAGAAGQIKAGKTATEKALEEYLKSLNAPHSRGARGGRGGKTNELPSAYEMMTKEIGSWSRKLATQWEADQRKMREDADWISDTKGAYVGAIAQMLANEKGLAEATRMRNVALIDQAQASREVTRAEAAAERLQQYRELLAIQQNWLEMTGKGADEVVHALGMVKQAEREVLWASDDVFAGFKNGLGEYLDDLPSKFEAVRDITTNAFKGMEDSLVDFVKTGKLNFSSLVDSILADIARITVRQTITAPLASALIGAFTKVNVIGGPDASGINLSTWGGLPGGLLGSYATGTDYVPQTGPYLLHKGEQVIPADKSGLTINVPVSVAGNNALASDLRNEIERTVIDVVRRHS